MTYYVLATMNLKEENMDRDYMAKVTKVIEKHGGKYLFRTNNFEQLDNTGYRPDMLVLIEWPTMDAAIEFYGDPEHKELLRLRKQEAETNLFLVPKEDVFTK